MQTSTSLLLYLKITINPITNLLPVSVCYIRLPKPDYLYSGIWTGVHYIFHKGISQIEPLPTYLYLILFLIFQNELNLIAI